MRFGGPQPLLANPAALGNIEASHDRPVWISGRDGKTFFDQLKLPKRFQPFMGRTPVSLEELLHPEVVFPSWSFDVPGLTETELNNFLIDGPLDPTV